MFLGIMVYYGCIMVARTSFQTSPAMQLPMSYVYVVIPFGCAVMLIYVIINLIKTLQTPASEIMPKGSE
ncbi:TRAP transporter small permease [Succinivibrio dextrinosolvens]|uniref:TRAP transporter small permease n=1 Tax=Succinivibrio dextrinosolvens TaxID=83771 RepID=UPI0022AF082B|nr:TRAP transporter small permease subunit [Succinivibrio dextrinosolvens]